MKQKRNNPRENAIDDVKSKKLREDETPQEKFLNSVVPCAEVEDNNIMKVFRQHSISKLNEKHMQCFSMLTTKGL